MHFGQPQIQDQQIKLVVGHQRGIGFTAACHVVNRRASRSQTSQQAVGQYLVIFCNQDAHPSLLVSLPKAAPLW